MAHYAYKAACYDIDRIKYQELVNRFEEEEGREHDGDSNYDGDNWYIMAMWINELRAKVAELESQASSASVPAVTDGMALAFHRALTDGSIGQPEVDEIKTGLRAALAAAPTPPVSEDRKDAEREATLLGKVERQSAALKLAKDAFSAINIEAKTFMSYENARNNFSDDTDERKAYERAMVKASELTKQAIAAIDAIGDMK